MWIDFNYQLSDSSSYFVEAEFYFDYDDDNNRFTSIKKYYVMNEHGDDISNAIDDELRTDIIEAIYDEVSCNCDDVNNAISLWE